MNPDSLDAVDRQIVHVLSIRPRASYRTIATVVGISDQTAARRYRRLREVVALRVVGAVSAARAGWVDWLVRLQITPGSATAVADALARRPDVRWVRLFAGGTEVVCVLQAQSEQDRDALFLHGLPGSRRVVRLSAQAALHVYSEVAWSGKTGALSADQLGRLPPPTPDEYGPDSSATENVTLEPADAPLLAELARDGRASITALAAATHWHESTVRRRLTELCGSGLVYWDIDADDLAFGFRVNAMLWLSVEPTLLERTGRAIAAHRPIPYAAAMTGRHNLVASAVFRDTEDMYRYLTGPLAALPGIRDAEAVPAIGTVKRAGTIPAVQRDARFPATGTRSSWSS